MEDFAPVFWVVGRIKQRTLVSTVRSKRGQARREQANTKETSARVSKTGGGEKNEQREKGRWGRRRGEGEGRNEGHTPVGINRRDERRGGPTLFPVPTPAARCHPMAAIFASFLSLVLLVVLFVLFSSSPPLPFFAPRPHRSSLHVKRRRSNSSFLPSLSVC